MGDQGCQILHPDCVRLAKTGQNWGLFRSVSVHFGLAFDLKKSQICPNLAILTQCGWQMLTSVWGMRWPLGGVNGRSDMKVQVPPETDS